MANPILSKNSNNKVSSPEQLNDYIKVSSVGIWLILCVLILFLVSVFVWAIFGSLTTTVAANGVCDGTQVVCYVDNTDSVDIGDKVKINGKEGEIVAIAETPVSSSALSEKYDEYTVYSLQPADWSYEVTVKCDDCTEGVVNVKIMGP